MAPTKRRGLELLLRAIDLCKTVRSRGIDPFQVDVREILDSLRRTLPELKLPEELKLDVEALREIAELIASQGEWIAHESSLLYVDAILLSSKIRRARSRDLAKALVRAWRPIVCIERISPEKLLKAVEYWNSLPPLEERMRRELPPPVPTEVIALEELLKLKLASVRTFEELLQAFWKELKERTRGKGYISYWDFIKADTYEEFVAKAYVVSFLVTYGCAELQEDPISGEMRLIPYEKRAEPKALGVSISVPVDYEKWESIKD